jgi:cullin-associated NEDD8-dissociated protein 1
VLGCDAPGLVDQKTVDQMFSALHDADEATQQAAAFALGHVAAAAPDVYVSELSNRVEHGGAEAQPRLLLALKELCSPHTQIRNYVDNLEPHTSALLVLLEGLALSEREDTRSLVARCLGSLAGLYPVQTSPCLSRLLASSSCGKETALDALRSTLAQQCEPPQQVRELFPAFVALLAAPELALRRQAVLTLTALAHAHPASLTRDLQGDLEGKVLPALFAAAQPDAKLVEVTDFGAFKRTVDHGLPLRKAAFTTLFTLADTGVASALGPAQISRSAGAGISDSSYDVQVLAFAVLTRLSEQPAARAGLLSQCNDFLPHIMKIVKPLLSEHKKGGNEQATNMLYLLVKCVFALQALPGFAEAAPKLNNFYKMIHATASLRSIVTRISKNT